MSGHGETLHGGMMGNLFKDMASFEVIVEGDSMRSKQRRDSAIMDDRAKFSKSNYAQVVNNLNKYYQLGGIMKMIQR